MGGGAAMRRVIDRSHYAPAPWSAREIEAQAWALERARRTGEDAPEMPSPYDREGRARWVDVLARQACNTK